MSCGSPLQVEAQLLCALPERLRAAQTGFVLIPRRYDPASGEPDYNAVVWLERAG